VDVFVGVAVAATGAVVEVAADPLVVFVGVAETVPAPVLITTVRNVPNGCEVPLDNLHVPVMLPAVAGAVNATEISAD